MIVLSGARIFDGENFLLDHAVVVEGERIAAIVPYAERPQGVAQDLAGGLLAPGYIDVQVNGGGGILFNEDPTPEAIAQWMGTPGSEQVKVQCDLTPGGRFIIDLVHQGKPWREDGTILELVPNRLLRFSWITPE